MRTKRMRKRCERTDEHVAQYSTCLLLNHSTNVLHSFVYYDKYRGGTSDATTSSSLILSLIVMSFDEYLLFKNNIGHANRPTNGQNLL